MQKEVIQLKNLTSTYQATAADVDRRLSIQPYSKVIQKLQAIRNFEDPLKKLKVIKEMRDLVSVCINEFWNGIDVDYEKLVLDAD